MYTDFIRTSSNSRKDLLKNRPEVLRKKLTEAEKQEADKKIEEKELKEALDKVSSGKTPGIDGIEREFLLRFWKLKTEIQKMIKPDKWRQ